MDIGYLLFQECENSGQENGKLFKGQVTFLKLSVGSVPGTDHSQIYAFLINNRFQAEKRIYMSVPAQTFFASVDPSTLAQLQK